MDASRKQPLVKDCIYNQAKPWCCVGEVVEWFIYQVVLDNTVV